MDDYNQYNYSIIASIFMLFMIDAVTKVQGNCTNPLGIVSGAIIGYTLGVIFYTLIYSTGYKNLLYLNELTSNNVTCSKPSNQQFKCAVYKNGTLISG